MKNAKIQKRSPRKSLHIAVQGRPKKMQALDEKVQNFLLVARGRGSIINTAIAIATATGFMQNSNDEYYSTVTLGRPWAQSLFRRMGFVRRFATTGKVEIPEGAKREAELFFIHQIVSNIEKHEIPASLVMNLDQTPMKYVPCGKTTLEKQGTTTVPIHGVSDKRMITATFTITLDAWTIFTDAANLLGKNVERSIPKAKFPRGFSLSANPKHFSNEKESIKLLEEIIIPYVKAERGKLGLEQTRPALLILDVFRGQTTSAVTELLHENNILVTKVPANMTNLYQPLDLSDCKWICQNIFEAKIYGMVRL